MDAVTQPERKLESAAERWARFTPIHTGEDYLNSLRGRPLRLFLFGKEEPNPVDNPLIRPSMNALRQTYDLAIEDPELATAHSPLINARVNRFLHIVESPDDLVMKNRMQRRMGQLTGTCFQRCAGLDAISVMHSITYDIDQAHGTEYHQRFINFLTKLQEHNQIIAAGMTDPKGDRSKAPHEQEDPDLFMHVTHRNEPGRFASGAKAHMTGGLNSHWMMVLPTMRLSEQDKEFAVIGVVPLTAEGLTYIYGRQSCDTRSMEEGKIDQGNAQFAGQEVLAVFDNEFIPWEHVFMVGAYEFAAPMVERFTNHHRASYVCKTGLAAVLAGAAATT